LQIDLDKTYTNVQCTLISLHGQILHHWQLGTTQLGELDLSKFNKGIYLLQVKTEEGIVTLKVSKM